METPPDRRTEEPVDTCECPDDCRIDHENA